MTNTDSVSTAGSCALCGLLIPPGAPFGQCPKCLMNLGSGMESFAVGGIDLLDFSQVRRFGEYELIEEIARGGMGVVYRARQLGLGREVAVKMILAGEFATGESVQRFRNEAAAAARLDHPHIVSVYEIGEHETQHYFSMRLVAGGRNIAQWAKQEPRPSFPAMARMLAVVVRAVAFAHERGVLHRDLKPSNILVDENDEPHVTDFGLAKMLNEHDSALTLSAAVLGSPSYMAPEQAEGRHADVTTATDVYGLGAVLYEMLASRPPFVGGSPLATAKKVLEETPAPLGNVPRDLATVCMKCLEKVPRQRYTSARELAEDLERFARGEPIRARRVRTVEALWRWAKRRPRIAALLGALWLAFVLGFAGVTWQWSAAVAARKGEADARAAATATVVDLYTQAGLIAAKDEPTRAALWFAQAAVTSRSSAAASAASLTRWAAWRAGAATPVRAFESGVASPTMLAWQPAQEGLIVTSFDRTQVSVWDLPSEKRWLPDPRLLAAVWTHANACIVVMDGQSVRLLEYPSAKEVARISIAANAGCLAVSPDDRWIAVGTPEPFLWEATTGLSMRLPTEIGAPSGLEFSRDGERILFTTKTQRGVCAVATPDRFLFPPVDAQSDSAQGFLGRGELFVALGKTKMLNMMSSLTGEVVESFDSTSNPNAVPTAISPDGKFIGRRSATLLERPEKTHILFRHTNGIDGADFNRDGTIFATASADDTVRLWRLPDANDGDAIGWHQEGATGVGFSPDGRFVATGQDGLGIVRVWRLASSPEGRSIKGFPNSQVTLSHDGRLLAPSGSNNQFARTQRTRVFAIDNLATLGPEIEPGGGISGALFSSKDDSLFVLSCIESARDQAPGSGSLQQWDFRAGRMIAEPISLPAEPSAIALHPDGTKVAIYGARRTLCEVDLATRQVRQLHANPDTTHPDYIRTSGCFYTADGAKIIGWGMIQPPVVWDRSAQKVFTPPEWKEGSIWGMGVHAGFAASVSQESAVRVLSLPDFAPAAPPLYDVNWLFLACFSPDGKLFLTGGRGRIAHVWDWRAGSLHCPGLAHEDEIFTGAFLQTAECVVTGGQDHAIRFWDRHTGLPLRPPLRQSSTIDGLTPTLDGRRLISNQREFDDIRLYEIADLLPPPRLPAEDALLLAEIEAAAEVHRGTLEPLSPRAWMEKWRQFREKHPEWHRWGSDAESVR